MWWEVEENGFDEFCHWHAHEHFPERLGIPGFQRATRWRQTGQGCGTFVMYELEGHSVLSSPDYLARLNSPTPWSVKMMPLHHKMVRSQCEVIATAGTTTANHALTIRLSLQNAPLNAPLLAYLEALIQTLPSRKGFTGAHLLQHRSPEIERTAEEKIRGKDAVAEWVLVVTGYALDALHTLVDGELAPSKLKALGAEHSQYDCYELAVSATPKDMQQVGRAATPSLISVANT
ncbi:hypothetical protein E9531_14225 [Lampropedia puyangensis]|uniref:Uncharacterized protein n=1 Tax=Lampropedia puyangensis TaxID=1330072 RepID=A0A4S8EUF1_9BURK|nr:hypothetical protein [Lampropedia puyangensis]THT98479.1 hypothetical protein E9531_14225 [Lampropedia puyangensis]